MANICQSTAYCSKKNIKSCKDCMVNRGYSIDRYIKEVSTVECSNILKSSSDSKELEQYRVTGVQMSRTGELCDILQINKLSGKEVEIFEGEGMSYEDLNYCLSRYSTECKVDVSESKEKLRKISNGELFINPFRPEYEIKTKGEKSETLIISLMSVKALIKEKEDINVAELTVFARGNNIPMKKFKASEFGENFTISNVEESKTFKKVKYIKMLNSGVILPVVTQLKDMTLIIDNCYIYKVTEQGEMPIANWGSLTLNKSSEINKILEDKNNVEFKNAVACLGRYRKYIAPYGTVEPYTIKI